MAERIAIITDSCADIPEALRVEKHISTISVRVCTKDADYRDGIDIHTDEVLRRMDAGESIKTSLPSESEFQELLERLHAEGFTHAVAITMSSAISGTYQMLRMLCHECRFMTCLAFDSGMAAIAEGALALQLADEVQAGLPWAEVEARLGRLRENTHPYFGLDTLKYLMRGGRIGKVTAIAGEILSIKPILSFEAEGVIDSVEKTRGRKALMSHLVERIGKLAEGHHAYRLYFADSAADAERKQLEERVLAVCRECREVVRSSVSSALAVHLGPGLIGVAIQLLD